MNIFTTLNNDYYPRLKVFARTLRKHNDFPIRLTIMYFDLSQRNQRDFKKYAEKLNINVNFVFVDKEKIQDYKLLHQVTTEAYTKLWVLDVFPDEDRALWIDVDTVVLGDIKAFYDSDMDGFYVSGAPENKEKLDIKRLNLNENATYFNAGVILFNLKKIREDFKKDTLFEIYGKYEKQIRFADQDVVNIAFSSKVKRDEQRRYNYMIRSGHQLNRAELKEIVKNTSIMHFIRHIKPWHYYYQGAARFIYLREMFPLYPFKTIFLVIAGELYRFKRNKKTLENSEK